MGEPLDREVVVFNSALQMPPSERAAYLAKACAGDEELREQVEALLRAHEEAGGFLCPPDPDSGERRWS
jgi:serine/threonine-protein kinase